MGNEIKVAGLRLFVIGPTNGRVLFEHGLMVTAPALVCPQPHPHEARIRCCHRPYRPSTILPYFSPTLLKMTPQRQSLQFRRPSIRTMKPSSPMF
jgi:hypothetical protein